MAKAYLAVILLASSLMIAASSLAAALPKKQPNWNELSTEQQKILSPLTSGWDELDATQKRKWLGIANRFPKMKPAAQLNATKRMQDWAALTPIERQAARERFRRLEKLPPERKQTLAQEWEQYQQLPQAEREQLREIAKRKNALPGKSKTSTTPRDPASKSAGKLNTHLHDVSPNKQ